MYIYIYSTIWYMTYSGPWDRWKCSGPDAERFHILLRPDPSDGAVVRFIGGFHPWDSRSGATHKPRLGNDIRIDWLAEKF